jgi:hypothetical protein
MKKNLYALLFGLIISAVISTAHVANAALGESADSIASDRKSLSALRGAATVRDNYTIQTIESDATTVREYISPNGVVFGIAWNGLTHPDLTPLLGSYATEYREALRQTPRKPGRRTLQVKTDSVIVEKWGHMRNLRGRAYAPALIPPGVSIDEIK